MSPLHHEIFLGLLREALYLVQLIYADITSQPLSIANNLTGIIRPYPRHLAQFRRISHVQHDMLRAVNLPRVRLTPIGPISPISPITSFPHQRRRRQVVTANTDVGFQSAIVLDRQSIKSGEVLLGAVDAACCAVFIVRLSMI